MSKNLIQKLENLLDTAELLAIVDNSLSATEVLAKLGYSKKGQYVAFVRKFMLSNDICIDHWTPNGLPKVPRLIKTCPVCSSVFSTIKKSNKEQVTCSVGCANTYFRTKEEIGSSNYRDRAIAKYGPICSRCGFTNLLALQVHHIDRNRNNNAISNLEVLCANCHTIEHQSRESEIYT